MQIQPPFSAAAQAAGVTSQATSKDKAGTASPAGNDANAVATDAQVEQSGSSNSDRDAQGQGDGLPAETDETANNTEPENSAESPSSSKPAPLLPGEEPGELDILG